MLIIKVLLSDSLEHKKSNYLYKIKTKPLAVVRYMAGQVKDVEAWFADYRVVHRELNMKNKRNFDEAGFRVGCMKGNWFQQT